MSKNVSMTTPSDSVSGRPPKDLAVHNLSFSDTISQCSGQIKSKVIDTCLINAVYGNVQTLIANDITTNNLSVTNTLSLPPPSTLRLTNNGVVIPGAPISNLMFSSTTLAGIDFLNSTKLNATVVDDVRGSDLTSTGSDIQILRSGLYMISYRCILTIFSFDPAANGGAGGYVPNTTGSYGTPYDPGTIGIGSSGMAIVVGIVINDTYNSSLQSVYSPTNRLYTFSNFSTYNGSHVQYLNAGDYISLYTYTGRFSGTDSPTPTFDIVELTVTQLT